MSAVIDSNNYMLSTLHNKIIIHLKCNVYYNKVVHSMNRPETKTQLVLVIIKKIVFKKVLLGIEYFFNISLRIK